MVNAIFRYLQIYCSAGATMGFSSFLLLSTDPNLDGTQPFKIRIRFWRQFLELRQCPCIAGTPVREELREVFEATLVTFVPFPTIKIITQTLQSNSILQLLVKM